MSLACTRSIVDMIVEQAGGAGRVTARPMFGEYGLYCGDVLVALICDDVLFLKPTAPGRAMMDDAVEAPPYPGAKPALVVPADAWDDAAWMAELLRRTAAASPPPKKKRAGVKPSGQ